MTSQRLGCAAEGFWWQDCELCLVGGGSVHLIVENAFKGE